MTSGYILFTSVDIEVNFINNQSIFSWPSETPISFHPVEQAPIHPLQNGNPYPKFINQYAIQTPIGYSILFIDPMHRENNIFTILPGIVDTDQYISPVNFPFVLKNPKWEGLIPAGTPIAQVIPFKRDSWKMSFGSEKDLLKIGSISSKIQILLYNRYKKLFWSRKEYL
jgi:hypothetical protein